jgi:hypothetical protein
VRSAATSGAAARKSNSAAERALHRHVLGAGGHHRGELRKKGSRGIARGGQGLRLRHQLLNLIDCDREVQRFLGREVPVDRAGANARAARYLIERDAKAFRREHVLRGPQHPLAIAARVGSQLTVSLVSRW